MRLRLRWRLAVRLAAYALLALIIVAPAAAYLYLRASLPQTAGSLRLAGVAAPVAIVRDRHGVPHIVAASDADAWFALGFVHAQDRLTQMLWLRRVAQGRSAECIGEEGLASDRQARTLDLAGLARRDAARQGTLARRVLEAYAAGVNARLARIRAREEGDSYRPHPVKRVWIPKLGSKELRPLGVPTVEDRIVQTALRNVIEPIFEKLFAEHSYGFRPGRGAKDALRRVDQLLKAGKVWVVDADLKAYFDTIPQEPLMVLVEELYWFSVKRRMAPKA